jgi:very-short-patch-repair endonuclease
MNERHRAVLDIAARQHGVVTRAQARAVGLTDGAIDGCLANGLLITVADHIYRVRGAPQSERMAVGAAVLGTGGRASHGTGARLLELHTPLPVSPLDVTVDAIRERPRMTRVRVEVASHSFFTVRIHRFVDRGEPVLSVDGLRCVDANRVLIDVAADLTAEQLEAAFERARRLELVSIESLARRFALVCGRGRPGTNKIRELLAHTAPNALESTLEVKAWRLLRASLIPNPVRQLRIAPQPRHRYRLDFAWPDAHVAFETEGFEWHGNRARWKQDRIRTAALERLGWRIVIATWDDITTDPQTTLDRVAMALNERRALRRAG